MKITNNIIFVALIFLSLIMTVGAVATSTTDIMDNDYETIMEVVTAAKAGTLSTDQDTDGDGISDYDEINGFTWMNVTYFTNPYQASTDRDPYDDYMEITGINMPTAPTEPGRHPCVSSGPNLEIDLESIDYVTMCEITSSESISEGTESTIGMETSTTIEASTEVGKEGIGCSYSTSLTVSSSYSTSEFSSKEWSEATAVDQSEAAKLKFNIKIKNSGTDAAKNVKLRFNVLIGDKNIANTIWTDVVEWRIEPGQSSSEMVISKDKDGNDIIVSLDELKCIECGMPLTIIVTEINAEVPWEDGWITWDDYVGEMEPVTSTIIFDSADGKVNNYYVWSGLHLTGSAPYPYIHNITLMDAIDRTLDVEDREDGLYIANRKYDANWSFIFNQEAYEEINKTLSGLSNPSIYDILNINVEQGWEVAIKTSPDTEPPVISWACYSEDRKTISAGVSDNLLLSNVCAHVKIGNNYTDIQLKDDDGNHIFMVTLTDAISDTYDDYIYATDGKFVTIKNDITPISRWWPMFGYNVEHTGSSLSVAPDAVNLLWKYLTGGPVSSSPAVADGKVFVGSEDGYVYCLDMDGNEKKLWTYPTDGDVCSSPAVADGKVFVGSNDNYVYCLDMYTGEKIWKRPTRGDVRSSPAVADGKVFVGSNDGWLYCLDMDTGDELWKEDLSGSHEKGVLSSPAVTDGKVFVGSEGDHLHCLDMDGNEKWEPYQTDSNTQADVRSSPAVADGKVFFASKDDYVYCLDIYTGIILWKQPTDGDVLSSPAVADGKVFVGSNDGWLYCLDMYTGNESWNYTTNGYVRSSPAVADGKVFVGSDDNDIYCLDMYTGNELWNYTTGGDVLSSPAVADGKVFVGSDDGHVYCFGPAGLLEPTSTIESISPDIALAGEEIISFEGNGTDNGTVVAYQWTSNLDGVINTSENFSMPASELSVGTHSIFFKVQDDQGLWSTQDVGYVTVRSANAPAVVAFAYSSTDPVVNEDITFNASSSYDADRELDQFIKEYYWDFGDGVTATGKVASHSYSEPGVYNITFTATDYYGLNNSTGIALMVFTERTVRNINTSEEFGNIQHAIDDSDTVDGHTIVVGSGTYFENIDVDKKLMIISESGDSDDTIVQAANPDDHVFHVTADNVTVSGFYATGSTGNLSSGISLDNASHCIISDNNALNNWIGIGLYSSSDNELNGNTVSNNSIAGISLAFSDSNTICNNYFDNMNNTVVLAASSGNIWNSTKTSGTNIVGGPYRGGNYWNDYAGEDLDGDRIGDTLTPHNCSGNISSGGDFLPLVKIPAPNPDINSESETSGASGRVAGGSMSEEPTENVLSKESSHQNVVYGTHTKYDFNGDDNSITGLEFDSLKTTGRVTATIETLKDRSSLVSSAPSSEVYQYINIWIGSGGFSTTENIADPIVSFKVSKSWIEENDIGESNICLCRYSDGKWTELTTQKNGEDENYIYFESETTGFSPFAITGEKETILKSTITDGVVSGENDIEVPEEEVTETIPGFEATFALIGLLGIGLLVLRRKKQE